MSLVLSLIKANWIQINLVVRLSGFELVLTCVNFFFFSEISTQVVSVGMILVENWNPLRESTMQTLLDNIVSWIWIGLTFLLHSWGRTYRIGETGSKSSEESFYFLFFFQKWSGKIKSQLKYLSIGRISWNCNLVS